MDKLKIPRTSKGRSITLRLPEESLSDAEYLSKIKNTSVNKIITYLIDFSLENIDIEDRNKIEKMKKEDIKGK